MSDLAAEMRDLMIANRILAHEGVVDGYGHVSLRHPDRPDRFFLSRSRSPELVETDDLMEFDLDCNPIDQRGRVMYIERPIHGEVYKARPDVRAVVHNHAYEVIPFTVTPMKLRPLLHVAGLIGADIPVWDIRQKFGDADLLVKQREHGEDLARCLGTGSVALMRGHGCVVVGHSLKAVVARSVYLMVNARLQKDAARMGEITFLSEGEIAATSEMGAGPNQHQRVWEYWARRCGML